MRGSASGGSAVRSGSNSVGKAGVLARVQLVDQAFLKKHCCGMIGNPRDDKVCLKQVSGKTTTCRIKKHVDSKVTLQLNGLYLTIPSGKPDGVLLGKPHIKVEDLGAEDNLEEWLSEEHLLKCG